MHGYYILFPFDSCFSHIEVRAPCRIDKGFFLGEGVGEGEQNWRDEKVIFMSLNNEISDVT